VVTLVGGAALAGCAVLLVRADLTAGTRIAAIALWLLAALAVVTLAAFVREVERHRGTASRPSGRRSAAHGRRSRADRRPDSWKPLPSLVLLWVGGLTALAVFPFMLSGGAGEKSPAPDREAGSRVVETPDETTSTAPVLERSSSTSVSRSTTRQRPAQTGAGSAPVQTSSSAQTSPSSTSTPRTTTSRPLRTTTTSSTTTPTATTTTNPGGITITLLPKPTKTKG
jgi:hypothetical protein